MFNALVLEESAGVVTHAVRSMDEAALPTGDVTVAVEYTTVNYKDGLVLGGAGGLVKRYPHVPGIDFCGTVTESQHAKYQPGDRVILTGWRVGESQWGGYATRARVNGDWLVPLPSALSARQAMAIGTAGFTAMLAVMALESHGMTPAGGEVLVTGAAGGVGSVATALLAALGYQVIASTGRADAHEYLKKLGASQVIDRTLFADPARKPLEAERWAGCIDSVGGNTFARVLAQLKYAGSIAAVGLAGGSKVEATVIPFLLRGVNVLGIDSVMCPMPRRLSAWSRLCADLPLAKLEQFTLDATFADLPRLAAQIVRGQVRGRVAVQVS